MPTRPIPAFTSVRPFCVPTAPCIRAATLRMPPIPTNCAERTAFFKAVYDGHRDFAAIAVCGGKDGVITGSFPPCGVCRQVMREFVKDDFRIYMVGAGGYTTMTMAELLPAGFKADEHMAL